MQVEQLEKQTADIGADNWKVNMEQAKYNEKVIYLRGYIAWHWLNFFLYLDWSEDLFFF